jgi:hypothetical protein
VIVIGHQTISRNPYPPYTGRFFEQAHERMIILFILENLLAPPASVHYMVPGFGKFYPQWPRHEKQLTEPETKVKRRLDPFLI